VIIRENDFQVISKNSNAEYYSGDIYPDWTPIAGIHDFPVRAIGSGVEPHYHDNDEFWFWATGRGEVWLDGKNIPVGPNSVTYTPTGVVHKFLMHTDFEVVAVITKPERKKRSKHILVSEDGPPEPTVPGFVVPGDKNSGPFRNRGARCPLSELRLLTLATGTGTSPGRVPVNEHLLILSGQADLRCGSRTFELRSGDLALLRSGCDRSIRATRDSRLVLLRE
jgi:mannose-6-phosphate isomerase-like protein (cupin superfamily)